MKNGAREISSMVREAAFQPATVDVAKRTVDITWTTGARVLRQPWFDDDFYEELSLDPKHVRMDRLNSGRSPFLRDHNGYAVGAVMGVIQSARLDGDKGVATVRFPSQGIDPEADKLFAKISEGITPNVSVGYRIHKMEKVESGAGKTPVMRAVDWEPHEVSSVAIGADAGAATRSAESTQRNVCEFVFRGDEPHEEMSMTDEQKRQAELEQRAAEEKRAAEIKAEGERAQKAERERAASIQTLVRSHKLGDEFASKLVTEGTDLPKARELILEELAARSEKTEINGHQRVEVGTTDTEKFMRAAEGAILFRAGKLDELDQAKARSKGVIAKRLADLESDPGEFRGFKMADIARKFLERAGVRTGHMNSDAVVARALTMRGAGQATAGDFTVLLENVMYKQLLGSYALADDTWRSFCKTDTVQDFRPSNRYRTGSFGVLDSISEDGEFKNKPIPDGLKQSISVATKGNMIAVSRQAIVNDDMGAILDTVGKFGRAAGLSIESDVYALLNANSGLGATFGSNPFFDASNSNVNASGTALGVQGLDADRVVLAQQKDISANEYLGLAKFGRLTLLVPVALGGQARMINKAAFDVTQSSKYQVPNIVQGLFKDVIDSPRLTSVTRRYIFADPADAAAIVVAFLNGEQSPFMQEQLGWRVDGAEFKLRIDYQAQMFDPKGAITNAGA